MIIFLEKEFGLRGNVSTVTAEFDIATGVERSVNGGIGVVLGKKIYGIDGVGRRVSEIGGIKIFYEDEETESDNCTVENVLYNGEAVRGVKKMNFAVDFGLFEPFWFFEEESNGFVVGQNTG